MSERQEGRVEGAVDAHEMSAILKAIDWVQQWYTERSKLLRLDGFPYLTENEAQLIQNRFSELKVILSEHPYLELYQEVLAGRLHLRTSLPESYQLTPAEVKKLKQASKSMVGFYSPSLKEPNVFLNPTELLDANLHWEKSQSGTVNGSLSKAAVHEITHAVTAGMRNELVVEGSLSQLTVCTRDDYWDHPSEIYARIAELRYNLNVEPGHVFTEQEVRKIRARCEQDLKQYKQEVKEIGKKQIKSLNQLPLDGKLIDHQLFIRYSDNEIMHLLNDTALRDSRELDREHQSGINIDKPVLSQLEVSRLSVEPRLKRNVGTLRLKA